MSEVNRVWRLRRRPVGNITDDVLSLEEEAIPEPGDNEFLFRLNYLSLDPTNRIWMSDMDQYMPPVDLNAPMRGVVCGTVLKSNHPDYVDGAVVSGLGTWVDYQIGTPETVNPMGELGPVATVDAFSTFAVVGPTAYFGLLDIAEPKAGELSWSRRRLVPSGPLSARSRRSRAVAPLESPERPKNVAGSRTSSVSTRRSIIEQKMCPTHSPPPAQTASTSTSTTSAERSSTPASS